MGRGEGEWEGKEGDEKGRRGMGREGGDFVMVSIQGLEAGAYVRQHQYCLVS